MTLMITQQYTNPSNKKAFINIISLLRVQNGKRMAKASLVKNPCIAWKVEFCQESGPRTVVDTCNSSHGRQVQEDYNSELRREVGGKI